jgi:predicted metal-dependent phosphoesterase TrpH
MHTVCSDGQLQPEHLMHQAVTIGLKGFAITDHHTVEGYYQALRWLSQWQQWLSEESTEKPAGSEDIPKTLPQLWTGVEVTSILLDTEVHILGYGFDPAHTSMSPYLQHHRPKGSLGHAACVIDSIQDAGGLAVLAHPSRYRRSPEELIPAAAALGINGVEAYYAYNNPSPWRTSVDQTARVQQISQPYNLLQSCGTDTHGRSLLQRI